MFEYLRRNTIGPKMKHFESPRIPVHACKAFQTRKKALYLVRGKKRRLIFFLALTYESTKRGKCLMMPNREMDSHNLLEEKKSVLYLLDPLINALM